MLSIWYFNICRKMLDCHCWLQLFIPVILVQNWHGVICNTSLFSHPNATTCTTHTTSTTGQSTELAWSSTICSVMEFWMQETWWNWLGTGRRFLTGSTAPQERLKEEISKLCLSSFVFIPRNNIHTAQTSTSYIYWDRLLDQELCSV